MKFLLRLPLLLAALLFAHISLAADEVSQPVGMDKTAYLAQWPAMSDMVYVEVLKRGGSISAEHGIGPLKAPDMLKIKSPLEIELMRGLKALFDSKNILNPGRVLPL